MIVKCHLTYWQSGLSRSGRGSTKDRCQVTLDGGRAGRYIDETNERALADLDGLRVEGVAFRSFLRGFLQAHGGRLSSVRPHRLQAAGQT